MIHPLIGGEEEFATRFDPGSRRAVFQQSASETGKESCHDDEAEETQMLRNSVLHS